LDAIRGIRQESRDEAAVNRARLRADAGTEETRLDAVTGAGARVAKVQARTAKRLADAWSELEGARQGDGTARALTCMTRPVTTESNLSARWELPVWGPSETVPAIEAPAAMSDADLDAIVTELRDSETPPMSYNALAKKFRDEGHQASETRLRASWKRVTEPATKGA
ncbi:protein spdB, partial [Streptomyces sp. BH105]